MTFQSRKSTIGEPWPEATVPSDVRDTPAPPPPEVRCPTCHEVWTLEDAVSGGRFGLQAWHRYQCLDCEYGIPLAIRDEGKEAP